MTFWEWFYLVVFVCSFYRARHNDGMRYYHILFVCLMWPAYVLWSIVDDLWDHYAHVWRQK